MNTAFTFHIATIGDSSVGKTSIIRYILGEVFDTAEITTVGVDFSQISRKHEDKDIVIELWDTAGQERFRSLVPIYCKRVNAALAVFDVSSRSSYDNMDSWIDMFKSNGDEKRLIYIVGNKSDLVDLIEVDLEGVRDRCNQLNLPIFFVSAKTGEGINEMMEKLINDLMAKYKPGTIKNKSIFKVQVENQGSGCSGC